MVTVDRVVIRAPTIGVSISADVEQWPHILSHYRWFASSIAGTAVATVEMRVAPIGIFRYPHGGVGMTVDRRRGKSAIGTFGYHAADGRRLRLEEGPEAWQSRSCTSAGPACR